MKIKNLLQQFGWEFVNPLVLKLKHRNSYSFNNSCFGINLGCGIDNPDEYIGLDGGLYLLAKYLPFPIFKKLFPLFNMSSYHDDKSYYRALKKKNLIYCDLTKGIPFKDNTIPNVYTSHFLEHLAKDKGFILLKDVYRVLKSGGILRIVVPSLAEEVEKMKIAAESYSSGDKSLAMNYLTFGDTGYTNYFSLHKYMYDFEELKTILEKIGFKEIIECSFKKGNIPALEKLETREGLIVEAKK